MLDANISHAISKLDQVRRNEKKFLCINDDMNHASEEIEIVKNLLSDLYLTFFPKPSQFELPHEYRNRKLFTKVTAYRITSKMSECLCSGDVQKCQHIFRN